METKHTEGPLRITIPEHQSKFGLESGIVAICDEVGRELFRSTGLHSFQEEKSVANRIVHACNLHEELVALVKNMLYQIEEACQEGTGYVLGADEQAWIFEAKAVLAKAEGKE